MAPPVWNERGGISFLAGNPRLARSGHFDVHRQFSRGMFAGFSPLDGAPMTMLVPSSVVFYDGRIYVGNEANESLRPPDEQIDWAKLGTFTIVRFNPSGGAP